MQSRNEKSMREHLSIFLFLLLISGSASMTYAAPYFHQSDLISVPTAEVASHGIFNFGFFASLKNEDKLHRTESGAKVDLGLLNIFELDLVWLKGGQTDLLLGNFKVQLAKESGVSPSFAIGVDNFGEEIDKSDDNFDSIRYLRSAYALISKSFNLPILHIVSGHVGVGNRRYSQKESLGKALRGIFFGFDKDIHPSFLQGSATLSAEVDGEDANIGIRYLTNSGVQLDASLSKVNLAFEKTRKAEIQIGVSFTNREILKDLSETKKLSQQAAKIANEAMSQMKGKEADDDNE